MYLYILLLLFLLLFQASSSGPENFQEEHFTKNFELPLRGFFTLVIVFHHLSQYLDNPGPFRVFQEVGILCVAAFFFYSGYGLRKSVLTNHGYFHHFFSQEIYQDICSLFSLQCHISLRLLPDRKSLWNKAVTGIFKRHPAD